MGAIDASAQEDRAARQQLKQCEQTASRLGANVMQQYVDLGAGAHDRERPGLTALLERIQAGDVDYVIVAGPDRLARGVHDQLRLAHAFEAAGVMLIVATESADSLSPAAELTEAIVQIMCHFEHLERSEAAKRGWAKRRVKQVAR